MWGVYKGAGLIWSGGTSDFVLVSWRFELVLELLRGLNWGRQGASLLSLDWLAGCV